MPAKESRLYTFFRRQPWLYNREHDSMRAGYRHVAHSVLRAATRMARLPHQVRGGYAGGQAVSLNLGSGRHPLPAWTNVDINPFSGAQLWLDLRDRWPLKDGQVRRIYTRHCFEHFTEKELRGILSECRRVLAPGGALRVGVPCLEVAIQQYLKRDFAFAGWTDRHRSVAKKFWSYITDDGGHKIVLDREYLRELLEGAGFTDVRYFAGGESSFLVHEEMAAGDCEADWVTLYAECVKPEDHGVEPAAQNARART